MPNVFALSNRPALPAFDRPEPLVAVTPDGADAPALALAHLSLTRTRLVLEKGILEALDVRLTLRPPAPPAPRTLQELGRSARRRLAEERQRGARQWLDVRVLAVDRLAAALEP